MQTVWSAVDPACKVQAAAILLGCLSADMVEKSSGTSEPQGILFADLRPLRTIISELRQSGPEILRPVLLFGRPERGVVMTFFERRVAYKTMMALARQMRSRNIINADDYIKIEALMAEKYGLSETSIIR